MKGEVDELQRRLASFYTRYAPEILAQRTAINDGEIEQVDYRKIISSKKLENARSIVGGHNVVGGAFDIFYGLGEIESREGMTPGKTLIISPTEQYNGCDGWLEFGQVLQPPFITVARTGSIGEAFVHLEPCAPNSDCLVLIPRARQMRSAPHLLLVASTIRAEKWRYNYGRKITPSRISDVNIDFSDEILNYAESAYSKCESVILASLSAYSDRDLGDGPITSADACLEGELDAEVAVNPMSEAGDKIP